MKRFVPLIFFALLAVLGVLAFSTAGANTPDPTTPPPPDAAVDDEHVPVVGPDGELLRNPDGTLVTVNMEEFLKAGPGEPPPGSDLLPDMDPDPGVEGYEVQGLPFYLTEEFQKHRNP